MRQYDVVIIGAGAAGMMCAIEAGKRGRSTLVIDHADAPGEKIRISGGGRSNFTNLHTTPANFLSENAHFCKSALSRYTQQDFIKLVTAHGIAYHEKTLGQLFCDHSAKDIINMLQGLMEDVGVELKLGISVKNIIKYPHPTPLPEGEGISGLPPLPLGEGRGEGTLANFILETTLGTVSCTSLVIATGGLSIPKMGATGFGYDVARQFGIDMIPTRAALVPLLFDEKMLAMTKPLSGLSVDGAVVTCGKKSFREALLFTHRGLSGPSILQISSYWDVGRDIEINLLPDINIFDELKSQRQAKNKAMLHNVLSLYLPKRLADMIAAPVDASLQDLSDEKLKLVADNINRWKIKPIGSEGYRTAEVTLGGVDTNELSSKTFEAKKVQGLYFIGEVVDVTGHLGGFNFQWAWASGWCAGQFA